MGDKLQVKLRRLNDKIEDLQSKNRALIKVRAEADELQSFLRYAQARRPLTILQLMTDYEKESDNKRQ